MHSTSIAPQTYFLPILTPHPRPLIKPRLSTFNSLSITTTSLCCTTRSQDNNNCTTSSSSSSSNHSFLDQFYSPVHIHDPDPGEDFEEERLGMWWTDIKAAIGQRFNIEGLVTAVSVVCRNPHLAIPHLSVPDLRFIDWDQLKSTGFQGVVFDKDNTITAPYSLSLWPPLASSLHCCKSVFGDNVAVFSNSAGLQEYDGDGRKARILEAAIGIRVIRHRVKKPAGTAEEIEEHFGCESSKLIMVGDRPFTDIVYGNRNGFLTILTEPFSLTDEPFIVKQVRKLEVALVNRWSRKGCRPNAHVLVRDPTQCVKNDTHI